MRDDVPVGHCRHQAVDVVHGIDVPVDFRQVLNGGEASHLALIVEGRVILNGAVVLGFDEGLIDGVEDAACDMTDHGHHVDDLEEDVELVEGRFLASQLVAYNITEVHYLGEADKDTGREIEDNLVV